MMTPSTAIDTSQPCKNGQPYVAADGSCLRCGADQGVACRDPHADEICHECNGTGDSGEVEEDYAPATWDDPGWREFREVPCRRCGGTGYVQPPLRALVQRLDQLDAMMRAARQLDDETPF